MEDRIRRCIVPLLVTLAVLCGVSSIEAGGFAVPDSDVVSSGVGGASVAHPTGAASQFKNVAGLAFIDRPELSVGVSAVSH